MVWSKYNYLYYSKVADAYLLYSSLSNMLVKIEKDIYPVIQEISQAPSMIDKDDEQYKFLFDGKFIVDSNEIELNKIILRNLRTRFSNDSYMLTIAPTRQCNFACPYCYEKKRLTHKQMSQEVINSIISFVDLNCKNKSLNVVWYGGEPTECVDIIEEMTEAFQKVTNKYSAYMITNGYNLDRLFPFINELSLTGMQITLDGTKDTHNKTRILKSGGGSYDKIISNIKNLLKINNTIRITIRMNISKSNSEQYPILCSQINSLFGNRVSIYPAFVHDYDNVIPNPSCFESGELKADYLSNLYLKHKIYPHQLYPARSDKGCTCHQDNGFVIGPEGELYKCWHHLGMPEKVVGNITSDNIIDNNDLLTTYMLDNDSLFDKKCRDCVLFPVCDGGCSDLKNLGQDYCVPAKYNLEKFLDLRYMRMKRIK